MLNNCDIKEEVDLLLNIKNIKFDKIENDEQSQLNYYKEYIMTIYSESEKLNAELKELQLKIDG